MSDVIHYYRTLKWSDFREISDRPSWANEVAQIDTGASITSLKVSKSKSGSPHTILDATITVTMNRNNSWVVRDQKSDSLLKHEQGHYNLQAIAAWDLKNGLLNLSANSASELSSQKKSLLSTIQSKLENVKDRYEAQTQHGKLFGAQATWSNRISEIMNTDSLTLDNLPL